MKKLYRKSSTAVHPTASYSDNLLTYLPAAILTLTIALSPEDKEILAYLLSSSCSTSSSSSSANFSSNNNKKTAAVASKSGGGDHLASFSCNCFRCYMSYWVKWDASPNRQLIHEIIDAFEDYTLSKDKNNCNNNSTSGKKKKKDNNTKNGKKDRRNNKGKNVKVVGLLVDDEVVVKTTSSVVVEEEEEELGLIDNKSKADVAVEVEESIDDDMEDDDMDEEMEKEGSVRRFVSFLGERIWSVWG